MNIRDRQNPDIEQSQARWKANYEALPICKCGGKRQHNEEMCGVCQRIRDSVVELKGDELWRLLSTTTAKQ